VTATRAADFRKSVPSSSDFDGFSRKLLHQPDNMPSAMASIRRASARRFALGRGF
jgi:hypothetical protein